MSEKAQRIQKRISIRTAGEIVQVFWPDFVEVDGCIFAAFQCQGGELTEGSDGKTGLECFINHTHLFDEFGNKAEHRIQNPEQLDETEAWYDDSHPDFVAACDLGRKIARMWAFKLKLDFPQDRFRVYYTQYDNPIVRFHKVRVDEPEWLSDDELRAATDPSFRNTVIYDTEYVESPVTKSP